MAIFLKYIPILHYINHTQNTGPIDKENAIIKEYIATITHICRAFLLSIAIVFYCKSNSEYKSVKTASDTKQRAFPIKNIILLPNLFINILVILEKFYPQAKADNIAKTPYPRVNA